MTRVDPSLDPPPHLLLQPPPGPSASARRAPLAATERVLPGHGSGEQPPRIC